MLDRMACAGRTAIGFPAGCLDDGNGNWDAADPDGPALHLFADDGLALEEALGTIATNVRCSSSCPDG